MAETAVVKAAFVPVRGYAFTAAPADVEKQVRTALTRDREANAVLRGFGIRTVTKGSVPAAIAQVYEFERSAPPAIKNQFAQGVLTTASGKPRVVRLGGKDATLFVQKETKLSFVLYVSPGPLTVVVSGPEEEDVRRVAGAIIAATR